MKIPWWLFPILIGCVLLNFAVENPVILTISIILFFIVGIIGYARWVKDLFN